MFFGKKLKELRREKAKMGTRRFADKIGIKLSILSKIERGLVSPPQCEDWINNILINLNLEKESHEAIELYNLWLKPFVMQKMDENIRISPFAHKNDGSPLSVEEYEKLQNFFRTRAKKHNKEAERYNKSNGL